MNTLNNIPLSDAIAQALNAYSQAQQTSVEAIVEAALETFLTQQGYLSAAESTDEPLESAVTGFRQGWHDVMTGNTMPIDRLWDGIDVE